MFTGIVKACVLVTQIEKEEGLHHVAVQFSDEYARGLQKGASVSISGVCLTVTGVHDGAISFDIMGETIAKTTLGILHEGDRVNIERSATLADEIGGHMLSGHITGTAEIITVEHPVNNHVVAFRVPHAWMKYILPKVFIALDGASLTIVDIDAEKNTFTVWLIPETLRITTFGFKTIGDRVNVEIDSRTQAIVDTVEKIYAERRSPQ